MLIVIENWLLSPSTNAVTTVYTRV